MKVCVLASGSKGNSTYVETKNHKVLIDLGTSSLATEKKLKDIGVDPNDIDGILITHSHVDHISGIRVFVKKYNPNIYTSKTIYKELKDILINANVVFLNETIYLDELKIDYFKTSHDTEESLGYILEEEGKSLVYITDTGYINLKYLPKLKNREIYILESNHDVEMLLNGSYPYNIKQRILGDRGHLSNKDSAYYFSKLVGEKTHTLFLAHLSHENNTETLALNSYKEELSKKNIDFNEIYIAKQNERSELVEV